MYETNTKNIYFYHVNQMQANYYLQLKLFVLFYKFCLRKIISLLINKSNNDYTIVNKQIQIYTYL